MAARAKDRLQALIDDLDLEVGAHGGRALGRGAAGWRRRDRTTCMPVPRVPHRRGCASTKPGGWLLFDTLHASHAAQQDGGTADQGDLNTDAAAAACGDAASSLSLGGLSDLAADTSDGGDACLDPEGGWWLPNSGARAPAPCSSPCAASIALHCCTQTTRPAPAALGWARHWGTQ